MAEVLTGPVAAEAAPGRREISRRGAVRRFKWIILAPLMLLLFSLLTPVLLLQLYFSFHQWTVYLSSWWNADFVGFDIFQSVFTDPRFGWAVLRSLLFAGGSTIGCFVLGFLLAYLIYRPFRGQALYYALFILPMLTVPIVIAYTGQMLLDRSGPLNDLLTKLTGHNVQVLWLSNPDIALLTVTLLDIWNWTPFSFIIMLAGLASLPQEPIEAAQILGASSWRIFWEVQLPLLRPVILLALVLRFLDAMGAFPIIWGLLQGGPGTATETVGVYIYITTWQDFNVSLGAAQSYVVMVMMVLIVLAGIKLLQKEKRSLDKMYEGSRETGEAA
ncbi:MAG: carbohydrate ABC transporter permease [Alphaproteobacteria bacterium]